MLVDLALYLYLQLGIVAARVLAPARAAELQRLAGSLFSTQTLPAEQDGPTYAYAAEEDTAASMQGEGEGEDHAPPVDAKEAAALPCPDAGRRLTSDLVGDQDPTRVLNSTAPSISEASSLTSLAVGSDSSSSSSLGTCPTPSIPAVSAMGDFRELSARMEEFRASTPEMKHLLGLLLRSNEDNQVLKSALLTTLAKLQASRDELQATRQELHVSQDMAHLLLAEREATCFSLAEDDGEGASSDADASPSGAGERTSGERGSDSEASSDVRRSLDVLLTALEGLRTTADSQADVDGGASGLGGTGATPSGAEQPPALFLAGGAALCGCSVSGAHTPGSSASPTSNVAALLMVSASQSPTSSPSANGQQPTVHLKGVGYRVTLSPSHAAIEV